MKTVFEIFKKNFLFRPGKWKTITPIWFNWLSWFLTLGAVGYLAERTKNPGLQVIFGISFIAFYMLITTAISDILNLKIIRHKLLNQIVAACVALIALTVTYFVLHQSIKDLLKG